MVSRFQAIKTLIDNGITKIPIIVSDVEAIIQKHGYGIINYDIDFTPHIELMQDLNVSDIAQHTKAFTYKGDKKLVFIRSDISNEERRVLLSHELGHIELEHISGNKVLGYKPSGLIDDAQEDEANAFALEFLAPTCILDLKHIRTEREISSATLLDEKRSRMIVDEVKNHTRFTNYELDLCKKFENEEKVKKNNHKYILIKTLFILLMSITAISTFAYKSHDASIPIDIVSNPAPQMSDINTNSLYTAAQESMSTSQAIVAITSEGSKFHRVDCSYVKNKDNIRYLPISDAIKNYEPCKACHPENQ